jgi:GNAT superfamily N-acetyltransferase
MARFDANWSESAQLSDGTEVLVRMVRPSDRLLMKAAWERLSPESRYRRFLSVKGRLTDDEMTYLTSPDGVNHVALGAVRAVDGVEEGLGVARFARLADEPTVAEPAIVVVDPWQRKGLGRLLLARLVEVAREHGIERFRSDVLASNDAMRALLAGLPGVRVHEDGSTITVEVMLADLPTSKPRSLLDQLLAWVAEEAVTLRRTLLP